jgi:hypothetical protein
MALVCAAAALLLCAAPPASADWSGDAKGDVLAIDPNTSALLLYRGNGAGGFAGAGEQIGSGWAPFTALLAVDFSGDRRVDLLARQSDGTMLMYRGNGRGGFVTGSGESLGGGWQAFDVLVAPGDFSGDGKPDLLARQPDGALFLYKGNGDSGFNGARVQLGSGWQSYTALLGPGDWNGDGRADLLARASDGTLVMYRGNSRGGWITGAAEPIGSGWQSFTALAAGGDFSGDGYPDILARQSDGALLLYRGNGAGGFQPGAPAAGAGWQTLTYLTLVGQGRPPRPTPPPPPPPPPPSPPHAQHRRALHPARRAPARQPQDPEAQGPPAAARREGRVLGAQRPAQS